MADLELHWYFKVDEACGITGNIRTIKKGATSSTRCFSV